MADIELVIKIPDHLYKLLKDFPSDSNEGTIENVLMKAVENGTVLEPHGRCIDADAIIKDLNTLQDAFVINFDKTTGKFIGIACTAPTILKAWGNEE